MPIDQRAPDQISTPRLILRPPQISDAAAIFSEYAQDAEVARYMTWRPHSSPLETEEFLRGCAERWQAGTEFTWVITLTGDDRAIGAIACRIRDHAADVGYVLARRLWNTGLMTEALTAITNWALAQPAVHRVWAVCDTANPGSARVMYKAGMQPEGVLRRWILHPNISNEPRDCFVYARVR